MNKCPFYLPISDSKIKKCTFHSYFCFGWNLLFWLIPVTPQTVQNKLIVRLLMYKFNTPVTKISGVFGISEGLKVLSPTITHVENMKIHCI